MNSKSLLWWKTTFQHVATNATRRNSALQREGKDDFWAHTFLAFVVMMMIKHSKCRLREAFYVYACYFKLASLGYGVKTSVQVRLVSWLNYWHLHVFWHLSNVDVILSDRVFNVDPKESFYLSVRRYSYIDLYKTRVPLPNEFSFTYSSVLGAQL